jgi:hypothetical protein
VADSALYYPYLNVPETGALNAVLLYWDELGAIVPRAVSPNKFTRDLVAAGLVSPIAPRDFRAFYDPVFLRGFEELLDGLPPVAEPAPPIFVHIDKGTGDLWELLDRRGLVTRSPDDQRRGLGGSGWLCVEGRAGALYLAYVASWLASLPDIAMEPITDSRKMFAAMGGLPGSLERLDGIRRGLLAGVLPAPEGLIPVSELASFKESHRELLRLFRRTLEARILDCAREADPAVRDRLVQEARIELRDGADEVRRRLSERRWPTRDRTFYALLTGVAGAATGFASNQPAGGVIAGAAPLVIDFVHAQLSDRLSSPPFATYAVLAQEEFGG